MEWHFLLVGFYILDGTKCAFFLLIMDIFRYLDDMVHQHLLSPTETEHILGHISNTIGSVLSELAVDPAVRRCLAALLTLCKSINVLSCWDDICRPPSEWKDVASVYRGDLLDIFSAFGRRCTWKDAGRLHPDDVSTFKDDIRDTSFLWLCKILAVGVEISGSFFPDGSLYTELAFLYARAHNERTDR